MDKLATSDDESKVGSADALFSQVYDRLKLMASRQRRKGGEQTFSTTEIVHELYLRMDGVGEARFSHDAQFFAYAARAMRSILIDTARRRHQLKKGAGQIHLPLEDPAAQSVQIDSALALALDAGLRALEAEDARAAQVVELHFFAGLDLDRIGELLGIARRTVDRDWRFARAFLADFAGPGDL
jgi:RNA polymerase sigma factor (TIGR02999 family)